MGFGVVCLQLPQLFANFKAQSADGLSMAFLIVWLLGDLTNLLGLCHQLVIFWESLPCCSLRSSLEEIYSLTGSLRGGDPLPRAVTAPNGPESKTWQIHGHVHPDNRKLNANAGRH